MRVFVIGATGVLGRSLLPLLVQQGHTVRALVRSPEQARAVATGDIETVQGDVLAAETVQKLPTLLAGCQAAIHIATAIPRDPTAPGAWDTTTRLRIEGTQHLLQASLTAGVTRYIQQSIVMAYPDGGDRWLDEQTPLDTSPARAAICRPVIQMEEQVRAVSPEQLQWCILRGGLFVGAGTMQDAQIRQLRAGHLVVPCDGSNFLSLIAVADMAVAIVLALQVPAALTGSIFNIVAEPIRNGDYLDTLAIHAGIATPARDPAQPCPPSFCCSNLAAQKVLGWSPVHSVFPV